MWKDFFYYSKTERQGIIVLVILILGVGITSKLLFSHQEEGANPKDQKEFEEEYRKFMASVQEVKQNKYYSGDFRTSYSEREITLAPFDPNTADSLTFLHLGLPSWMVKNILRYRSKQGRFRRPEDFKKIYGLTEKQFQTLRPYICIAERVPQKDTIQLLSEFKVKHDSLFKYPPGTILELNKADTAELKKIPGIGSGIARMIVNYRTRLGGFSRIEQLQEIHLKAEKLRAWFAIDKSLIHPINLNKASIERLMHHPYLNFYQAKVIVEYRKNRGKLNSFKELSLYEEFTPKDLERISVYFCFD